MTVNVAFARSVAVSLLFATCFAWGQAAQRPIGLFDGYSIVTSAPWRLGNHAGDSTELHIPRTKGSPVAPMLGDKNPKPEFVLASDAGMLITVEHRKDHRDALHRLAEIASEFSEPPVYRLISGWPAIERRYRGLMPQPGDSSGGNIETSFSVTAIAVESAVMRFDTTLAPDASPKLLDSALNLAHAVRGPKGPADVSQRELKEVEQMAKLPSGAPPPASTPDEGKGKREPRDKGVAVQVQTGLGELEVASNDGQHVVVAANSGYSFSNNFGATYAFGGGTPCNQAVCDGDPSLAVGNSGAIYYAWIGGTSGSALSDGVSRSTNNGQTFTFQGLSATCPGSTSCTVADQEHIAADRANAATGGGDRIYSVWRNFAPTFSIRISCSKDSGVTWTSGAVIGSGDLPRTGVGSDGFVYVSWASGGNLMLHKFSNCDAGLAAQVGWPITVTTFTNVVCPVPGLDRCNGRNILSSPMVAADDLDPAHIYYAFATSTGAGNEDVRVFDSTNGGASFARSVRVNNGVTGRRYMPWISTYGGMAVVSWYDRRSATAGANDLTRFYIGGAAVRGPNLVALAEHDLSGSDDGQCSTWPCATNATTDSESCSVQPQLGGVCSLSPFPVCDFSSTTCPSGGTCSIGRGCPKYGDYNGNAAALGRHFSAWSSATPPASIGGASGGIRVYASADLIPSDFYVRDWNSSPTTFDNGAQPSTNPVFWATSDIWNQNATAVESAGADGSILGDPPTRSGSNFVLARISRRAAAASTAPSATVTANFYFGDYGLGAPFVPIGSETVTFSAGDMTAITPAHAWSIPATASGHLCLAVEIAGPDGDTIALPSVSGTAPGPADPMILSDNNKAQRNLQEAVGTGGAGTELIAEVRNSQKEKRSLKLRIKVAADHRIDGTVDVVGGRTERLANGTILDAGELAPGEARWVRFRVAGMGDAAKGVPIDVFEDTDPPANGFTILLREASFSTAAQRVLVDFAGTLSRLAAIEKNPLAQEQSKLALRASERPSEASVAQYLARNRDAIARIVASHLKWADSADPFEIEASRKDLLANMENADRATSNQRALSERLDAHLSMLLRARRDVP